MWQQLLDLSIELTFWLQGLGDWLNPVMQFFTFLGNEEFYLFVLPVILWVVDYNMGARLGILLMLCTNLNEIVKMAVRQPRPYWVDPELASVASPSPGYGLPSGHTQNSLAVFVVIFTVLMIGLSRIYTGEHFLTDVLGGLLVGGLFLWAYLRLEKPVSEWVSKRSDPVKILSAFVISLTLILLVILVSSIPPDYQIPQEWLTNAHAAFPEEEIDPFTLETIITGTGAFFGLAVGIVWTHAGGGFAANRGAWWQRLLRFVVGLVGVLVFWMGLGQVFPDNGDLISFVLRYVRYTLVGLWMAGGSIWVFLKLKLGERS